MSWVALGVGVGGTVLSAVGGGMQGNSSRQAQQRMDDDQVLRLRSQQGALGNSLLGPGYGAMPLWQQIYGQGIEHNNQGEINQGLAGINSFTNSIGGPVLQQQRDLANAVSQRQTGNLNFYDQQTGQLGQQGDQNLAALMGGAQGAEGMARTWGAGQSQNIRRDAERGLSAANQQSDRSLTGRGLGNSSLLVRAQQRNRQSVGETRDSALQNLANSQIDRQLSTRAQTLGIQERGQGQNLANAYNRAGGRMTLENQNLTRDIGLRQDPINLLTQTLGGNIMNPYSNYQQSGAQAGGSGTAIGSLGGSLAAFGSSAMGQQNNLQLLQTLMQGGGGQPNWNQWAQPSGPNQYGG